MASYPGLSRQEAARRLIEHGKNRTSEPREIRFGAILLGEIKEPMILLLLGVAAAYFLVGNLGDAIAVLVIMAGILLVEVWTEYRAKRSIRALNQLSEPDTVVIREGESIEIPVEEVVPGDLIFLRAGSSVPADARLLRADDLAVDESTLTGESTPVEKSVVSIPRDLPILERSDLLFRGTMVTRGEAVAEVISTGKKTQIGQIIALSGSTRPPRTPLQLAMRQLSRTLAGVAVGFAILVPVILLVSAKATPQQALLTGLSLAFATIPEELPILITIVLGLGSLRLAREHALVRELRAAETMGHVTVIVTDKTGTLTENQLRLSLWVPAGGSEPIPSGTSAGEMTPLLLGAYRSLGVLSGDGIPITDPLEQALSHYFGQVRSSDFAHPERIPFARERGWSGAIWQLSEDKDDRRLYLKGAPEGVLERSTSFSLPSGRRVPATEELKANTAATVAELASKGYRVLAVAEAVALGDTSSGEWSFLGLLALADPLRPEAAAAVDTVRKAGIKVLIATGDHPEVARTVAGQVGLPVERVVTGAMLDSMSDELLKAELTRTCVFARISPIHKLRIVQTLQELGHIVAMTGDGNNDVAALKAANVGVAMGKKGTDAAREVGSLVLTDDRFATLATAVREGRGLFASLQKAVRYYLAVKVGLVTAMLLPALFGSFSPFSPVMIIVLELFMDLAASSAFVIEPPEGALMALPPRPSDKPFLDADMKRGIIGGGLLLAGSVLLSALLGMAVNGSHSREAFQTYALVAWMTGHVALAYRFRTWLAPSRGLGWFSNRVLNLWGLAAFLTSIAATYLPQVNSLLGTYPVSFLSWVLAGGAAIMLVWFGSKVVRAGMRDVS